VVDFGRFSAIPVGFSFAVGIALKRSNAKSLQGRPNAKSFQVPKKEQR